MIERKSWDEFRETGLLLFVNEFLHIFGWCLVVEVHDSGTKNVYPARTNFRGFGEESQTRAYAKISKYMEKEYGNTKDRKGES